MLINHNDCSGYYYKHCQTIPNSCLPWVWIISLHGRFIMECTTLISYFDRGARRMAVILLADEPWLVLAGGFEWKKGLFLFWNEDPQFISISGDDTHIEHMENHHAKNGKPWCLPSISIGAIENPWRTGWTWRTMISMDVVEGGPKKSTESKKTCLFPPLRIFLVFFFHKPLDFQWLCGDFLSSADGFSGFVRGEKVLRVITDAADHLAKGGVVTPSCDLWPLGV